MCDPNNNPLTDHKTLATVIGCQFVSDKKLNGSTLYYNWIWQKFAEHRDFEQPMDYYKPKADQLHALVISMMPAYHLKPVLTTSNYVSVWLAGHCH